MSQAPYLSVVSPCFNEELVLPDFYKRMKAACDDLGQTYEIVLVNDGSRDRTPILMDELAGRDAHVVAVHLSRNHGHQLALSAGLTVSRGENVLVIDADLQDPPELLSSMMDRREAGVDVVYGKRRERAGETWFKRMTAHWFYRFLDSLTDTPIPRDTGDFRLMSRRSVDWLLSMPERHRFIRGMVSWIGFKQEPIIYDRDPRFAGESKYPLRRMLRLAMDAITGFSIKPLTLAVYLAMASGGLSLLFVVYAVLSWFGGEAALGWSSLMVVVSMMSCLQFVMLGIQGQYLGRLYEQSKGRPLFIIDRIQAADSLASSRDGRASSIYPASSRRAA
ncbi:glycosyltransferase family 2 protein [bacterium]|nr:glycosyltransferase family 2 protein [bacterium]